MCAWYDGYNNVLQSAQTSARRGRVSLDDFNLLTVIGRGSYAKVLQVEHKATKQIYAMKIIKKEMFNDDEVGWFTPLISSFHCMYLIFNLDTFSIKSGIRVLFCLNR